MRKGDIVRDSLDHYFVIKEIRGDRCDLLYLTLNANQDSVLVMEQNDMYIHNFCEVKDTEFNAIGTLAQVANEIRAGREVMSYK